MSVNLSASIQLVESGNGTTQLNWNSDADLGGLLAELSPSLIKNSTDKFTREFFDSVKRQVSLGQ